MDEETVDASFLELLMESEKVRAWYKKSKVVVEVRGGLAMWC